MPFKTCSEIVGVVRGKGYACDGPSMLDCEGGNDGGRRRGAGDGERQGGRGEVEEECLAGGKTCCDEMSVGWRGRPGECFDLADLCLQAEHGHLSPLRTRAWLSAWRTVCGQDSRRGPIRRA